MTATTSTSISREGPPTAEERRLAVVTALGHAPVLIRLASRYCRSLEDAEDAYQRAMEIALERAPVVEPDEFMAWLQTVVRNEAVTATRRARLESPGADEDVTVVMADLPAPSPGPHALAEWRERYRGLRAGLATLTHAQRVCLMLRSAGASRAEIAAVTGFSDRKVERSILEGRERLHGWDVKFASGDACARILPALARVADGDASGREARAVARHVKHCAQCRAVLSRRRDTAAGLASLVPVGLVAAGSLPAPRVDGAFLATWWERVASGATVRAGTAWQHAIEIPAALGGKVAAGAAAAVVAAAAGGPYVADAVRDARAAGEGRAATVALPAVHPPAPAPPPPARPARQRPTASQRPPARRVVASTVAKRASSRRGTASSGGGAAARPRPAPAPRVTVRVVAPPRAPRPAAAPRPSRGASLEFGP